MTRLTGILLFHRAHCGPRCRWGFFHVGVFPIEVAVIADEAEVGGWGLTGERGGGVRSATFGSHPGSASDRSLAVWWLVSDEARDGRLPG